jgi:hypothetical protein
MREFVNFVPLQSRLQIQPQWLAIFRRRRFQPPSELNRTAEW